MIILNGGCFVCNIYWFLNDFNGIPFVSCTYDVRRSSPQPISLHPRLGFPNIHESSMNNKPPHFGLRMPSGSNLVWLFCPKRAAFSPVFSSFALLLICFQANRQRFASLTFPLVQNTTIEIFSFQFCKLLFGAIDGISSNYLSFACFLCAWHCFFQSVMGQTSFTAWRAS